MSSARSSPRPSHDQGRRHLDGGESPYDCVTEIGFVDREALALWNEWYFGPEAAPLRADEANFMDLAGRTIVVTEELTPARA